MDATTARAWLDREIAAARLALAVSPGDASAQGRLGRLGRHSARLDAMGDAYLPTIAEAAGVAQHVAVAAAWDAVGEAAKLVAESEAFKPKKARK